MIETGLRGPKRKAWNTPGALHALTFSTYRRRPLFLRPGVAELFLHSLDEARRTARFRLFAYVVMPEHCHVLLQPVEETYAMGDILRAIKSPAAKAIFSRYPGLREGLAHARAERETEYRFWQPGGGYDRNIVKAKTIRVTIAYIHANPVRRGLCEGVLDWPLSSAPAYHEREPIVPVDEPTWWD